ncbi:hypothetical protein FB45DRAFT_782949 [Roridomyces roridus]|uniref:Uncharacterized protein n=1 Tax=Roridomyces roridus TaxID=1738132 RepID=A0AAD7CGX2_9AGAR|nr:hypothetical protein FB45DRAFT_782949 [Roridomyces roridus]
MTLPPHFTTLDLSGRFVLNPTLSDSVDDILSLQGITDATLRRSFAHGILSFNHCIGEDDGVFEHIWVDQELEGQRIHSDEKLALDGRERVHYDPLLGPVVGRISRVKTHRLEPPFLRSGWTPDTRKYGVLNYHVSSGGGRGWVADETWGIEEITGLRHFARHIEFTGADGKNVESHLVYDYVGSI